MPLKISKPTLKQQQAFSHFLKIKIFFSSLLSLAPFSLLQTSIATALHRCQSFAAGHYQFRKDQPLSGQKTPKSSLILVASNPQSRKLSCRFRLWGLEVSFFFFFSLFVYLFFVIFTSYLYFFFYQK